MASAKSFTNMVPIESSCLRRILDELPALEKRVLTWRYGLDGLTLTRQEIADRLKLEPSAVVALESAALDRLRAELEAAA